VPSDEQMMMLAKIKRILRLLDALSDDVDFTGYSERTGGRVAEGLREILEAAGGICDLIGFGLE
jgi:hypothetical protein